jgi:hypothetical protein
MITNPSSSLGSIHLKLTKVNHKHHIEDMEVSFPNKTLKNVVVEVLRVDLASNSKLDFMEVPKVDELNGAKDT